jgi:plastocyanin
MTNYVSVDVSGTAGTTVTERSGTTSSDTISAGSTVAWRNTGAGAHVVTITTNNTTGDGLAVADRTISLAAGETKVGKVPEAWGDANDRCAVAIDGTASEVKFIVMGGL